MRAILVLLAAGISCGCGGTDSPPTKIAPLATSAPTTVDELAEEYSLGEYGIRPPKGFELKSDDDMPDMKGRLAVWRSADDRRALSAAIFTVPTVLLPATREKVRRLGRSKGMTDVEESGFGFQTIAGLVFEKCTAEHSYRKTDKRYYSLVYAHTQGTDGILLTHTWPVGDAGSQGDSAEAAIHSFRKRPVNPAKAER